MPHIRFNDYQPFTTPVEHDGVLFDFLATRGAANRDGLISTVIDNKKFLLQLKFKDNYNIIKSDKRTRVSPNHYLHRALSSFARLTNAQVISSNTTKRVNNHIRKSADTLKSIEFFAKRFPTEKEVWIEVGFGSGRHLLHQAKENPDKLMIGIEIHKPSIEQLMKQAKLQDLENIMVLDYDARLFLEFVPSNLLGKIFVHFPVPWDKKPHRRVISEEFIKEAQRALKPSGTIELRTDSENYFAYSYSMFLKLESFHVEVFKNRDISISSKYEERWKRMSKNIYDITLHNYMESKPLNIQGSFEFNIATPSARHLQALAQKTSRYEDSFIHFGAIYTTDHEGTLFSLAMGSYKRPEHLYLHIDKNTIEYYPNPPVKSRINLKIHNLLKEHINE